MAANNGLVTLRAIPAEFLEEDEEENEGGFQLECKKVALLGEIERERLRAMATAAAAASAAATAGMASAEADAAVVDPAFVTEIVDSGGGGGSEEEDEEAMEAAKEAQRAKDEELKKEMRRAIIPQLRRKAKPEELREDIDVVRAAVLAHGGSLCYAGDELQEDKAFVLSMIAQQNDAWICASDDLREDEDFEIAVKEVILATTKLRAAESANAKLRQQVAKMSLQLGGGSSAVVNL